MIDAFLFDMDGVLADSEGISVTIGREYFEKLGIYTEAADFDSHLGMGEEEFFNGVARDKNAKGYSYEDASAFFKSKYPSYLEKMSIALNGVGIIDEARKAGIKVAIASSAPEWKVWANIDNLNLRGKVDYVVTGKDVKKNKPAPDIYRLCLEHFNLRGENAVVFEDAAGGIRAGKAAGCNVIAMMTTISIDKALDAGADIVVTDLSAIPAFATKEEFTSFFDEMKGKDEERRMYGLNWIKRKRSILPNSHEKEAIAAAWKARENAYVPFSSFKVGAAIVSAKTGKVYSGCNVENSSFGATICAERNAILSAVSNEGIIGIEALYVVSEGGEAAVPCAECLQVIAEFASPETRVVLLTSQKRKEYKFRDLLPSPFLFRN